MEQHRVHPPQNAPKIYKDHWCRGVGPAYQSGSTFLGVRLRRNFLNYFVLPRTRFEHREREKESYQRRRRRRLPAAWHVITVSGAETYEIFLDPVVGRDHGKTTADLRFLTVTIPDR